jgi:RND family efflux transporter MFP subunit
MRIRLSKWHLALFTAAGIGGLTTWYAAASNSAADIPHQGKVERSASSSAGDHETARIEVVKPERGGIERTTNQPGSVIAFESARLFAKESGYLKSQSVDIGDHVKQGQVLAEIAAPERIQELDIAVATLKQAQAQVAQADARVESEKAAHKAAMAAITEAEAELGHTKAVQSFRDKQYHRIKELFDLKSIDERLVDEKLDEWESASASHHAAQAAVVTATAKAAEAAARVAQANADAAAARANVLVCEAQVSKAKVLVEYLQIVSPYDGVITERNFFRGDFIRNATTGGNVPQLTQPLLSVARTDKVRVMVQVPDDDVPLLNVGDPVDVTIDALRGEKFTGTVSRYANAEDSQTRLMRAEVDLPNPDNRLHPGMYGRAIIHLSPNEQALRVPSAAILEQSSGGHASLYVVRDGKAELRHIRIGKDNGAVVEVVDGLSPDDDVIVSHSDELADGVAVQVIDGGSVQKQDTVPERT